MKKFTILVVDDDHANRYLLSLLLEREGYFAMTATSGEEALEIVKETIPDLILLDLMMPGMDGIELCRHLRASPKTKNIPLFMLTGPGKTKDLVEGFNVGLNEFMNKPYEPPELLARIASLLKHTISQPYDISQKDSTFLISYKSEHRLNIRVHGETNFRDVSKKVLELDATVYSRYADNTHFFNDWRFHCKQIGQQLYQKFFEEHLEVLGTYNHLLGAMENEELLRFRFESDREFLKVPLEFFFTGRDYLILRHPIARTISGIHINRKPLSPDLLNKIWSNKEDLRVLLIASNTKPDIPGVEQEVEHLKTLIENLFSDKDIALRLEVISTQQATYNAVRERLRNCNYHIIHYAGHGSYNMRSPEQSCLFFWEKQNQQGEVKQMPISELKVLLRNSHIYFIYLSCCLGTATSDSGKLLDDDFLGIADGLIQVGIPSVLGFRYPVSDNGAVTLAHEFYTSLAEQGKIDTALLHARCEVAMKNRDDITWISPILIMQD